MDKVKSYDEIRRNYENDNLMAVLKKTYDFLKQKFGTLFLFINKILNSRILTNVLLIIVLCELLGIRDAIPHVHNIYESEITDAVEKALRSVFYRY